MPLSNAAPQPSELLAAYTTEVLNFSLSGPALSPLKKCTEDEAAAFLARAAKLAASSGAEAAVLLGAGYGPLAARLQENCPGLDILVCEPLPQRAREALAQGYFTDPSPLLLTDASLRALWFLARGFLAEKKFLTFLNPELQGEEAEGARTLQRLLQFNLESERRPPEMECPPKNTGALSVCVIAHPTEPDLETFLAHIPAWVAEVALLWDAPALPEAAGALAAQSPTPLHQAARPLQGDFAAQRNHALTLCAAPWALSLDVDERLAPEVWEYIREEIAAPRAAAYLLPRLTLYPDEKHFRMGYGLWPDPQLRLFKRESQLRYINPVHEILTGFSGSPALLPHCPITHLSYVLKNRSELTARLVVFNQAAGREAHRLNESFPHLPLAWHTAWRESIGELSIMPLLLKA